VPEHVPARRLQGLGYSQERAFFVTFRTAGSERFFLDQELARLAANVLLAYRKRGWFRLNAFCVMPDHVHLLLRLREEGRHLSTVIAAIKNQITYQSKYRGGRFAFSGIITIGYFDRMKPSVSMFATLSPTRNAPV
jgi:REP element-mobilizing transposase RayT